MTTIWLSTDDDSGTAYGRDLYPDVLTRAIAAESHRFDLADRLSVVSYCRTLTGKHDILMAAGGTPSTVGPIR